MGMTILSYPDRRLFEPSKSIEHFDEDLRTLIMWMKVTMKEVPWGKCAALAAPQIGRNVQLCIVGTDVLVNPKITSSSPGVYLAREGCYSRQEQKYDYPAQRHFWVIAEYKRANGVTTRKRFTGVNAQALQHCMDHLAGRLCAGDRLLTKSLNQVIETPVAQGAPA